MVDRRGILHGVARHHDSKYGRAHHCGCASRGASEYEIGAGQLHLKPGGFHSYQWVDGGSFWHAARVCIGDRYFYSGVISLRDYQQHSFAGRLPDFAGLRRIDDGARWAAYDCANFCAIGTDSGDELCRDSRIDWPHARTNRRRLDRRIPSLAIDFLREHSDWTRWFVFGLPASSGLPREENGSVGYCRVASFWF